ncbi:MAG: FHA domain-containing protein [Acidimicrobiales bacterium]
MSDARFSLAVALASGSGLIGRRDHTLLFVPEPDDRVKVLLDAFTQGPVDETWDRLAEAVIDQGFDVCAFACLSAAERIEIRVFGDLELTTDLRSAPMLSGAGSGTWVEHRAPGNPRSASITTAAEGVDERTSLLDGVVHAGGFTAALVEQRGAISTSLARTAPPATTTPISIPTARSAIAEPATTADPVGDDSALMSYVDQLEDAVSASNLGDGNNDDDRALDTLDPAEAAELIESVAIETIQVSDDIQEPSAAVDDAPVPTTNPSTGVPTVPARVCKTGHANQPSRTTCEVCDVFLPAGPDGVTLVDRPSLGTLVFDGGRRVALTGDVMIGRNPTRSGDQWIPAVVEGERISRTHLTVRCSAWEVFVEDVGSHNGTVVVPADGSQPIALVSGTPYLIEPGATAYFGSSSFRFVGRGDDADETSEAAAS